MRQMSSKVERRQAGPRLTNSTGYVVVRSEPAALLAAWRMHKLSNALVQVIPGELTIITGVPNSGKSEWIDALLCNLAELHGWSFALCSMEKKVSGLPSNASQKNVQDTSWKALPFGVAGHRPCQAAVGKALPSAVFEPGLRCWRPADGYGDRPRGTSLVI